MNVLSDERKKNQVEKHISTPGSKGFCINKTKTNFVPTLCQDALLFITHNCQKVK